MILSKSRDFWFALLPVVGPDAAEFYHVNSAVFCRLQLAFNLPQQFSQPVDPQTLIARSPIRSRSELRGIVGCMHNPSPNFRRIRRSWADQTAPLAGLEFIAGLLTGERN
jgi:hypothetical protein